MATRYISIDFKDYTVDLDDAGMPERMRVGFYGYKGRLTYREVKKGGPTWHKVALALRDSAASRTTAPTQQP